MTAPAYARAAEITLVPLKDLHPAPWNPRLIRDTRFQSLLRSLVADPGLLWRRPILASQGGEVMAGNMRLRAVNLLWAGEGPDGWPEAADAAGIAPGTVPGVVEDVPEQIAKERAIRDNNQSGEWQEEDLAEVLFGLEQGGSDMSALGWDEDDMAHLRDSWGAEATGSVEEDEDVDLTAPDEPITQVGDLWLLGPHRLLCGDATDAGAIARLMNGQHASVLWTDPPYGVSYVGKTADALTIANDGSAGIAGLLRDAFAMATTALIPGAAFYICRPAGRTGLDFLKAIDESTWRIHEELQWVKDSMVLGHSDYHLKHETIVYGWLPGDGRSNRGDHEGSRWYGDNAQVSTFEIDRPKRSTQHPTMKPPDLIVAHLKNSSRKGEIVLDLFGGSGSTMVAAHAMGRMAYLMEVDPRYCDVVVTRWKALTGMEPERVPAERQEDDASRAEAAA